MPKTRGGSVFFRFRAGEGVVANLAANLAAKFATKFAPLDLPPGAGIGIEY